MSLRLKKIGQLFINMSYIKQIFIIYTLLIGVCGSLGQICITYAYRFAPAGEISIYNYTGIIFSMLLGYTVLGESLSSTTLIGSVFVIIGSLMVYFNKNKKNQA